MKIAVIIPCFRVTSHIESLLANIGDEVSKIYIIDDCCPDNTGELVRRRFIDKRIFVHRNEKNLGVGGAVKTGYLLAINDGCDIAVKLDGDGQMDPSLIKIFIGPIINGYADYTKGNRFFSLENLYGMPRIRIFGNAALSFLNKFSSGYWNIFDPTNGYTAIHINVLKALPLEKISNRYFFESDILFRLNTLRAVVIDIPMKSIYAEEESGLEISKIWYEFLKKHTINSFKRLGYNYFLRDLSVASFQLIFGFAFLFFGFIGGIKYWIESILTSQPTPTGTIVLIALEVIVGLQMLLAFLSYDIESTPRNPISSMLESINNDKLQ
jgi:dolichol-phosphate mannosyltransferase